MMFFEKYLKHSVKIDCYPWHRDNIGPPWGVLMQYEWHIYEENHVKGIQRKVLACEQLKQKGRERKGQKAKIRNNQAFGVGKGERSNPVCLFIWCPLLTHLSKSITKIEMERK